MTNLQWESDADKPIDRDGEMRVNSRIPEEKIDLTDSLALDCFRQGGILPDDLRVFFAS